MKSFEFRIPYIPDCTEYRFAAQAPGGGACGVLYDHWTSLLHMFSRFRPGELAMTLRGDFDPGTPILQRRLFWRLRIVVGGSLNESAVEAFVRRGPVSSFYEFIPTDGTDSLDHHQFGAAAEILRSEEALAPRMNAADNPAFEYIKLYYAVHPLKPREQNDYLMLDRLLSRIEEPVRVELRVEPAELPPIRNTLAKYIGLMMSVNQGRDDLYLEGVRQEVAATLNDETHQAPLFGKQVRRDPIADKFLNPLQELQQRLREPHLHLDARVIARSREVATLIASVIAESAFTEGHYQVLDYDDHSPWFKPLLDAMVANGAFTESYSDQWFDAKQAKWAAQLRQLARLAPVEELKGLWHLPVGAAGSPCCMYKSSDPGAAEFAKEIRSGSARPTQAQASARHVLLGYDLEMGLEPPRDERLPLATLFDGQGCRSPLAELDLGLFNKHLFIAGVPGSGKTTAVFNLLVQLHRHGIPFLVIEPAKTEYRMLKTLPDHPDALVRDLAAKLQVYTVGDELVSPMRFNPLAYPPEVSRDEHIDALISCFKAGMEMFGPMEIVISESLEQVYRESDEGTFPTMKELLEKIRTVVKSKGYQGEVLSNVTAATEVRIGGLTRRSIGHIFAQSDPHPGIASLLTHPTVIEMDHMGSQNGCLMTLFLLAAMREHIKNRPSGSPLSHVIVIEEAHNIVGRVQQPGSADGGNNPKAHAAEFITRMLAEMRALGEGIVVVDQLPSAVAPEVIKNTGTKLALRQVSEDDREELGATMLLAPQQVLELARLRVGEAYLYHENLHAPRRVRCLNSAAYLDLRDDRYPAGIKLGEALAGDPWFDDFLHSQVRALAGRLFTLNDKQVHVAAELSVCKNYLERIEQHQDGEVTLADIRQRIASVDQRWLAFLDDFFDEYEVVRDRVERFGSADLHGEFEAFRNRLESESLPDGNDIICLRNQLLSRLETLES